MRIYDGREFFYQWDLNQKIVSDDFKVGDEIHFANPNGGDALIVFAKEHGGAVVADVPNILLQTSALMKVYRYVEDESGSRTVSSHFFKVEKRSKPSDYFYTETDIYTVEKAVEKAMLEAKESGAFDGADGADGKDGADGYTPQRGTDYWTPKDIEEIKSYVDKAILGGAW